MSPAAGTDGGGGIPGAPGAPGTTGAQGTTGAGARGPTAPPEPALRPRPTAALVRAAAVGVLALALALLRGEPALILAGLPLLAWSLLAVARRTARGEERS